MIHTLQKKMKRKIEIPVVSWSKKYKRFTPYKYNKCLAHCISFHCMHDFYHLLYQYQSSASVTGDHDHHIYCWQGTTDQNICYHI